MDFALIKKGQYYEIAKASVVLILEFQWSYESAGVEAGIKNSNHKKGNQNKNVLNLHLWWVYCKANLFPWLIKSSGWIFISISLLVFRFLRAEHWERIKISVLHFVLRNPRVQAKKKLTEQLHVPFCLNAWYLMFIFLLEWSSLGTLTKNHCNATSQIRLWSGSF